jgi:hypothetical protein
MMIVLFIALFFRGIHASLPALSGINTEEEAEVGLGDMMRPEIAQSPHPVSRLCVFVASKMHVA